MNEVTVQVGDQVEAGEQVGLSGGSPDNQPNAGGSSGPHLHLELRDGPDGFGEVFDPSSYVSVVLGAFTATELKTWSSQNK